MVRKFNVAVVGAAGAVGKTMLSLLQEREFPAGQIHAVASSRSEGKNIAHGNGNLRVRGLESFDFTAVDIALFSPGSAVSKIYAPLAADSGCVVIDNTSCFRNDSAIPLVVPEVNPEALEGFQKRNIIANPNCSTIQMVVALKPIYDLVGIERINVSTYQAVSGTGLEAIEELTNQSRQKLDGSPLTSSVYPHQIAFNCLPHIDSFSENGYTKEEMKMVRETKKIMGDPSIQVNPTCIRVPVYHGHSEAIHIETKEKITAKKAIEVLTQAPGIEVVQNNEDFEYPTASTHAENTDPVYVGRIREDISHPRGINLWVVSDNLRKGAALNSIQIAETLVQRYI